MAKFVNIIIFAWFLFMNREGAISSEATLVSKHAFPTAQQCLDVALLLQGGSLMPFYYCIGSPSVKELPLLTLPTETTIIQPPKP